MKTMIAFTELLSTKVDGPKRYQKIGQGFIPNNGRIYPTSLQFKSQRIQQCLR